MLNNRPAPGQFTAPVEGGANGAEIITANSGISPSLQGAFVWPKRFFERGEIAYQWENTPWISQQADFENPQDAISFFFRIDDDSVRYDGRIRPILDICHGPRPEYLGPVDGLKDDTEKKRYEIKKDEKDKIDNTEEDESDLVDAERRLLYLTDLDYPTILALVNTAPESQARLLADFFHKHLCARLSIGVEFASEGPQIFILDFHLPFRVWRKHKTLLTDERIKLSDGQPLRTSMDVSFLLPPTIDVDQEAVHGIYSGHIACSIIGYDQNRWTAHFAIDTWFDGGCGINDQVTRYDNDRSDGMETDPCSGGRDDAHRPICSPRLWFLRIMGIRLEQLKDEWESVCHHVSRGITRKVRRKQCFPRLVPEGLLSCVTEQDRLHKQLLSQQRLLPREIENSMAMSIMERNLEQIEHMEDGLTECRELLQVLYNDLQETVKIGAAFMTTEVNFFLNDDGHPGNHADCYNYLTEIRRKFNALSQLVVRHPEPTYRHSGDNYDAITRTNVIQLQKKNDRLISITPEDVKEVRVLALMTLVTLPFMIAAALFSADGAVPFAKNWWTFTISLLCSRYVGQIKRHETSGIKNRYSGYWHGNIIAWDAKHGTGKRSLRVSGYGVVGAWWRAQFFMLSPSSIFSEQMA
ncbi:hypothetical protein CSAL01_12923 [Colletotrichum salicis]|uniref:CorA-like Mg2+ transporter n=1 Tax=Colletotrichum salicis TaxID=1209931 RepID=A0A135S535_9PEZI|nr:hypothetical protein CSAL01_12923 [Colletotrichum salicis]